MSLPFGVRSPTTDRDHAVRLRTGDRGRPSGPPHRGVTAHPDRPPVMTTVLRDRPGAADEPSPTPRRPSACAATSWPFAVASLLVTASALVGGPWSTPACPCSSVAPAARAVAPTRRSGHRPGGPGGPRRCARWSRRRPVLPLGARSSPWPTSRHWRGPSPSRRSTGGSSGSPNGWRCSTEYLAEIPRTPDIAVFLQTFAERIAGQTPDTRDARVRLPARRDDLLRPARPRGLPRWRVRRRRHGGDRGVRGGRRGDHPRGSRRPRPRPHLPALRRPVPGRGVGGGVADGMFAAILGVGRRAARARRGAPRPRGARAAPVAGVVLGLSLFFSYGLALAGLLPVAVEPC